MPESKHVIYPVIIAILSVIQVNADSPSRTVLDCKFEGPYYNTRQGDMIQKGCINNYEWGKKELSLKIVHQDKKGGNSQMFDIKSIRTGAMQYFVTGFSIWRGRYYKVSFRAKGNIHGNVSVKIRKIGKPWKTYIPGISFSPEKEWKYYEFTGKAPTDVDGDIALTFGTGTTGRLWLDDIKINEYENAPADLLRKRNPLIKGNILPRSSFEGKADYLWTSGVYAGPDGEWEDPQIYRTKGGKFGKYALAMPTSQKDGRVFCRSFWLPVAADHPYTFSVYLKSLQKRSSLKLQVLTRNSNRELASKWFAITNQWKRYSITVPKIPSDTNEVYLGFFARKNNGIILIDGAQLEAGTKASEFKPSYPFELYGHVTKYRSNIIPWGQPLTIHLYAASAISATSPSRLKTRVSVTAFPNKKVMDRILDLPVNKEYSLTIPTGLNGLFRIRMTTIDPQAAAFQEIIAARLPAPRKVGLKSSFGSHITVRPFFIDYAKKIGIKWTRMHDASIITKWIGTEARQGHYKYYDTQVNALLAAGINILGLPDRPAAWAKKTNTETGNVIDLDAFKKLCFNLSSHYKGRIDYWEIWNEPYMKHFFTGTPKQYGEILSIGSDAIRKGNKAAKILGFCTEINDINYAAKIPPEDRKKIDILSFHCYFQSIPGGCASGYDKEVQEYLNFLKPVKPQEVWNTEGANRELGTNSFYSFMPAASGKINERAAAFGARVWIEQRKGGIDKTFIYTLHQSDTIMYYGGYKKLIGFDRSVTPAAVASAITAWCIDGLDNIPLKPRPGLVEGLFSNKKRSCWVVFDDHSMPGNLSIDKNKLPSKIKLYDVMGNSPGENGGKIKLFSTPIFAVSEGILPAKLAEICRNAIAK